MKKRNHYSAEFKSKIVLEVLQESSTVNEIAAKYYRNDQGVSAR